MKTTPIPVKFDRQGHSCNFYAGFGPTNDKAGLASAPTASIWIVSNIGNIMALLLCPGPKGAWTFWKLVRNAARERKEVSQRSLHYAPIFRLLLKVAVNGTHQCDFLNFCGASVPTISPSAIARLMCVCVWVMRFKVFGGPGKHERPIHEPRLFCSKCDFGKGREHFANLLRMHSRKAMWHHSAHFITHQSFAFY